MFKFRLLKSADFPLMLEWLSKKHVSEWWDDEDDTVEKIAEHYGKEDGTRRFILVEVNNDIEKPIGYFQYYFADEKGAIGIDQFIGEEDYINRGIGAEAVKLFVRMIFERHRPKSIILDPSPDNKRAIRCYEKVGFRYYETRKAWDDNGLAYMMRLETDKFIK